MIIGKRMRDAPAQACHLGQQCAGLRVVILDVRCGDSRAACTGSGVLDEWVIWNNADDLEQAVMQS